MKYKQTQIVTCILIKAINFSQSITLATLSLVIKGIDGLQFAAFKTEKSDYIVTMNYFNLKSKYTGVRTLYRDLYLVEIKDFNMEKTDAETSI